MKRQPEKRLQSSICCATSLDLDVTVTAVSSRGNVRTDVAAVSSRGDVRADVRSILSLSASVSAHGNVINDVDGVGVVDNEGFNDGVGRDDGDDSGGRLGRSLGKSSVNDSVNGSVEVGVVVVLDTLDTIGLSKLIEVRGGLGSGTLESVGVSDGLLGV